jgi:hypothetical protein
MPYMNKSGRRYGGVTFRLDVMVVGLGLRKRAWISAKTLEASSTQVA